METRAKSRKRNNGPDISAFFTPMGLLKWAAVILMLVFLATRFVIVELEDDHPFATGAIADDDIAQQAHLLS